jgi:hypothetical protein
MLIRKTPCRRVVALYVAQCRPPCVTEMPHCAVVASASVRAASAPASSCGATCVSKDDWTLASAARADARSDEASRSASASYAPLAASRVSCGSCRSCSSRAFTPSAQSRIASHRRVVIALRRASAACCTWRTSAGTRVCSTCDHTRARPSVGRSPLSFWYSSAETVKTGSWKASARKPSSPASSACARRAWGVEGGG